MRRFKLAVALAIVCRGSCSASMSPIDRGAPPGAAGFTIRSSLDGKKIAAAPDRVDRLSVGGSGSPGG